LPTTSLPNAAFAMVMWFICLCIKPITRQIHRPDLRLAWPVGAARTRSAAVIAIVISPASIGTIIHRYPLGIPEWGA
jgi:hypothetical protein